MNRQKSISRRRFISTAAFSGAAAGFSGSFRALQAEEQVVDRQRIPIKIGIRQASLRDPNNPDKGMTGNFDTFKAAYQIPGIMGVELQCAGAEPNMRDLDLVRRYKEEAHRWGLQIPSTSGSWDRGTLHGVWDPSAGIELLQAIKATELVGAHVLLVAFFRNNAPDMNDESSYVPIVSLIKKAAPHAADAGVILGLENSLSPGDSIKLVDLIDHPAAKVYYDLDNMFYYGHADQAVPGIKLLGKERICIVHVKNYGRLIDVPGRIDWAAAMEGLSEICYDGWLIFETRHTSHEKCIEDTQKNIAFIKKHFRPPLG